MNTKNTPVQGSKEHKRIQHTHHELLRQLELEQPHPRRRKVEVGEVGREEPYVVKLEPGAQQQLEQGTYACIFYQCTAS